jgi:subtilisin family serine protease
MKSAALLSVAFGLVAAETERYIIAYDEVAWNTLQVSTIPLNNVKTFKNLRMQVAELDSAEIREFSAIPGVMIEKVSEVHIADYFMGGGVQENPPSWGIDRIDQRQHALDKKYHYDSDGTGVDVYIVDTGVNPEHVEFGGRARFAHNSSGDNKDEDCNGHGTHVSSTIGGATVGVAKNVNIHGVKVLTCAGSGTNEGVIGGIDWVVGEHKKGTGKKSVINMSLGGGKSETLNLAVTAATKAGVTVVVAAGNESSNACNTSPASSPDAITVAASNTWDLGAIFSNFGECVHIYAPGVNIKGAWIGGKNGYKSESGTSMASPHVAGAAALVLGRGDASTPEEVKKYLSEHGTKGALKLVRGKTPNILLYTLRD